MKKYALTGAIVAIVTLGTYYAIAISNAEPCAGFAGATCPAGFECKLTPEQPDAQGKCVPDIILFAPIPY